MSGRIFIEGLRVSGAHGVHERERTAPQDFLVDVSIDFDTQVAGLSDTLADSYDYGVLRAIMQRRFAGESCKLLERLALLIADDVLSDERVASVTVVIRKAHIYKDCLPGISLTKHRSSV